MLKTDICNLFGIKFPIIQGGMAHLATAELASAVSNAGGLGLIAAANYDANWLRNQIRLTRNLTTFPFGVNLFLSSPLIKEQIKVVLDEQVKIVVTGAGDPRSYISRFKEPGIKVMPVISNLRMAESVYIAGADAIVAEGLEAGGHIGYETLFSLLSAIPHAFPIPVIAAGGVIDGRGLVASLALGAQGVQMGTRFIFSDESKAHPLFKNIVLNPSTDTIVIGTMIGRPIRCIRNRFSLSYVELEKAKASREELEKFIEGKLYAGVIEGDLDEGLLMCGQSIGRIKDIKPAKEIVLDIINQAQQILNQLLN
jgi:enoyl-[acyl-carrier protein] reductase II